MAVGAICDIEARGADAFTDGDRVHRGGRWSDGAGGCRSANRSSDRPGRRYDYDYYGSGFRLAFSPGH